MAANKHSSIEKAQSVAIPPDAKYDPCSGGAKFAIVTDTGTIAVELGRCQCVILRGTPEAIIGFGLILPEWMPGLPGNNATSQAVVFDKVEPRLFFDKARSGKRPPHESRIRIRAWGFITKTVEVRAPLSPDQIAQYERFQQQHADKRGWERYLEEDSIGLQAVARVPVAPKYQVVGNVVYLRPTPA